MSKNAVLAESRYEDIARRVLDHQKIGEIAAALGVTPATVSRTLNDPRFKVVYERVKNKVYNQVDEIIFDQRVDGMRRVRAFLPKALTEIFKLVENANSEKVKADAAKWVAGVCGMTPIEKKVQAEIPVQELAPDQIEALGRAMAFAAQKDAPDVVSIDVTVEDDDSNGTDG